MAIDTYQHLYLKTKLRKLEKHRQNHGYVEHFDGFQMGGDFWVGMGGEVRALRSTNRQSQNSHGDVKCSAGNGVGKELIRMTDGHEQWCGDCLSEWGVLNGGWQMGKMGQL